MHLTVLCTKGSGAFGKHFARVQKSRGAQNARQVMPSLGSQKTFKSNYKLAHLRKLSIHMKTYIALLRGINVGGQNKIKMAELVKVLESMGLETVRTYIQSGNVVFQSVVPSSADLASQISAAIQESHGFQPKTLVLGLPEIKKAIENNPFPQAKDEPKTLHCFFLAQEPPHPNFEILESLKRGSESYQLVERFFYLYAPEGIGRSKLAARAEKALGSRSRPEIGGRSVKSMR